MGVLRTTFFFLVIAVAFSYLRPEKARRILLRQIALPAANLYSRFLLDIPEGQSVELTALNALMLAFRRPAAKDPYDQVKRIRQRTSSMASYFEEIDGSGQAPGVRIEEVHATEDHPAGFWVRPLARNGKTDKVVVWYHGGGVVACVCVYVCVFTAVHRGEASSYRGWGTWLARDLLYDVFLVEYRRPPEHHFFDETMKDCVNAYSYVLNLGFRADQIILAGDSGGAYLTTQTIVAVNNRDDVPNPRAFVALSGAYSLDFDGDCSTRNFYNEGRDIIVDYDWFHTKWLEVITNGEITEITDFDSRFSPLANNLEGLPPALLTVGADESFLCETLKMQEKLLEANVLSQLIIFDPAPHISPLFRELYPEAQGDYESLIEHMRSL